MSSSKLLWVHTLPSIPSHEGGEESSPCMAGSQDVREAIDRAIDPEFLRPLSDLGSVRSVKVRRGTARIEIALVVPNYPVIPRLEAAIDEAATGVAGVTDTHVEYTTMTDQDRVQLMSRLRPEAVGPVNSRIIAVGSGKGGVGKSTVASNLAVTLADKGHSVGVIDADVWGFSIPKMLGVSREPIVVEDSIIPPVAYGVKLMSMDYFVGSDQAVIWRGPMLHKAVEQFLNEVWWDDVDFLLVDMPPGTGDVAISLSQLAPRSQMIVVTTPQPTAQRVAKRSALMAEKVNQEVIGIVENMSWFTGDDGVRYRLFGEGGGQRLADDLGQPLLAQVPLVPAVREGADEGRPARVAAPASEAGDAFARLADEIVARKPRVRKHPELVIRDA